MTHITNILDNVSLTLKIEKDVNEKKLITVTREKGKVIKRGIVWPKYLKN